MYCTIDNLHNSCVSYIGLLDPVIGLHADPMEGFLHITWNPPFTLYITDAIHNIWYCIIIYNITLNSQSDLLNTTCNLLQPEFDFRVTNPSPCDQFKFEVIPMNGVGNGTANSTFGYFFEGKL